MSDWEPQIIELSVQFFEFALHMTFCAGKGIQIQINGF